MTQSAFDVSSFEFTACFGKLIACHNVLEDSEVKMSWPARTILQAAPVRSAWFVQAARDFFHGKSCLAVAYHAARMELLFHPLSCTQESLAAFQHNCFQLLSVMGEKEISAFYNSFHGRPRAQTSCAVTPDKSQEKLHFRMNFQNNGNEDGSVLSISDAHIIKGLLASSGFTQDGAQTPSFTVMKPKRFDWPFHIDVAVCAEPEDFAALRTLRETRPSKRAFLPAYGAVGKALI
ncbi:MAG: hypothetical protein FWF24_01220 [Alphaproteobacteria bacterium]|nr:hypothetical protein [Alphaproteobacteria bacterium]